MPPILHHQFNAAKLTRPSPYSTTNVQKCLCGASNCRQILGPKPAGEKKPSTKKEQLDMASDLVQRTVSNNKRKASSLFDGKDPLISFPKELIKKRKVPQMSKGWAYVDEDMERQRKEEAEKDRLLKQLQRDGVVGEDINIQRPKYPSRGTKMVEKIRTTLTGGGASGGRPKSSSSSKSERPSSSKSAKEDELKLNKSSIMSRVSGSIRGQRKAVGGGSSGAAGAAAEKRKSLLSAAGSLRQSKLNFGGGAVASAAAGRSVSGASGEALLERRGSSASKASKVEKRASVISKASKSSKRASTVRVVGPDE